MTVQYDYYKRFIEEMKQLLREDPEAAAAITSDMMKEVEAALEREFGRAEIPKQKTE